MVIQSGLYIKYIIEEETSINQEKPINLTTVDLLEKVKQVFYLHVCHTNVTKVNFEKR